MRHRALRDGVIAVLAGLMLYGMAAGVQLLLGTGPMVSTLLEELGKAGLLLVFGWTSLGPAREPNPLRQARSRALGIARGLSLGLLAVAVFAGAENLAYLAAYPEAGVLARLLWSLPVHLVAALVEALGLLLWFRCREGQRGFRQRLACSSIGLMSLGLAWAWHLGANHLVSERLAPSTFAGGVVLANLLFLVLMLQFLRQAYLGGFLNGAD